MVQHTDRWNKPTMQRVIARWRQRSTVGSIVRLFAAPNERRAPPPCAWPGTNVDPSGSMYSREVDVAGRYIEHCLQSSLPSLPTPSSNEHRRNLELHVPCPPRAPLGNPVGLSFHGASRRLSTPALRQHLLAAAARIEAATEKRQL